jgi:coenzyme F420-reducing hydrogenase alpha subunit
MHATLDGGRYLTGPLARYSLKSAALSSIAWQAAAEAGLAGECRNPFRSIIVRAVEVAYAIEDALRIIGEYPRPQGHSLTCRPGRISGTASVRRRAGCCITVTRYPQR